LFHWFDLEISFTDLSRLSIRQARLDFDHLTGGLTLADLAPIPASSRLWDPYPLNVLLVSAVCL
jgi:hypothetical protein